MSFMAVIPSQNSHPALAHHCPTRSQTTVAPPYRPSASTSLSSHPVETPPSLISTSSPTPYLNSPSSTLQHVPSSGSAVTTDDGSTLQILSHQSSDLTPPPPIYKRIPSPRPSIIDSRDFRSKLNQDITSSPPPSYTPQAHATPLSTSPLTPGNPMNPFSELHLDEENASQCWCLPSFWKAVLGDDGRRVEEAAHHPRHVPPRDGRWNDAGYLNGGGDEYVASYGDGVAWRWWAGQYGSYIF